MTNQEAIELIGGGAIGEHAQYWLDLGCGTGTFTEALATMLPVHSKITCVDKNNQQLPPQMGNQVSIKFIEADFETEALEVAGLDGILMANSLHFIHPEKLRAADRRAREKDTELEARQAALYTKASPGTTQIDW